MITKELLKQLKPYLYEIPPDKVAGMKVPARIYITEKMLDDISQDRSLQQLINISMLPGVERYVIGMPDIHQGYGFPIGGVAATEWQNGAISPGGVGYDINCGVRLLTSDLTYQETLPQLNRLTTELMGAVPSGLGREGRIKLSTKQMDDMLIQGAAWCVKNGMGNNEDLELSEENGCLKGAGFEFVSERAKKRGRGQLGTLGSGNHFLEVQKVDEIFDKDTAHTFGLFSQQITVAIHCGSRGLGHQVCTDYVRLMLKKLPSYGFSLPDRELACAPANSLEGQRYLGAMAASANFAWANRQIITHHIRLEWKKIFGPKHQLKTLYDVCHNIAKSEIHEINGQKKKLLVHRKGATRAFGPNHAEIPPKYRQTGQPVIIPGTMGTASYILKGTETAMKETFGTVCHGAGRRMSRSAAKRSISGHQLKKELESLGIVVKCFSNQGLAEEAPLAYKDIESVVEIVVKAGLSSKVARLRPVAVIKGG